MPSRSRGDKYQPDTIRGKLKATLRFGWTGPPSQADAREGLRLLRNLNNEDRARWIRENESGMQFMRDALSDERQHQDVGVNIEVQQNQPSERDLLARVMESAGISYSNYFGSRYSFFSD